MISALPFDFDDIGSEVTQDVAGEMPQLVG
jgi:hypothetical protein